MDIHRFTRIAFENFNVENGDNYTCFRHARNPVNSMSLNSINQIGRLIGFATVFVAMILPGILPVRAIVTSDAYGTHIAEPNQPMFGINHDGVIQILRNGNFSCSGALLEGGRHVLTAGHCVSNPNGAITVRFELESGFLDIEAESWEAHPQFSIVPGSDVGIITLAERAPTSIPRYQPLGDTGSEIDVPNFIFGYGVVGHALTGKDVRDGRKRGGMNRYEATGSINAISSATVGGLMTDRWLFSDFDSGLAENDGFGFHFGKPDLGFGDDEVYASNGDSGAPIFVASPLGFAIAGVVSGGARYPGSPNSDLDTLVNATWGQFSRDTRISAPENYRFIVERTAQALERIPIGIRRESGSLYLNIGGENTEPVYVKSSSDLTNWHDFAIFNSGEAPAELEIDELSDAVTPRLFFVAFTERVE